MARRIITKAHADLFLSFVRKADARARTRTQTKPLTRSGRKTRKQFDRMIASAIRRAFEQSGLDPRREEDRARLLGFLAAIVYAGRGPGQPRYWTKNRLRRLRRKIEELRPQKAATTELGCCEILTKVDRYQGFSAKTLLRVLQKAKKLD